MKKGSLLLAIFLGSMLLATAQTADNKFAVGLHFVKNEYDGDFGSGIFKFTKPSANGSYNAIGLSLGYFLSPSFDLGLQGSYGAYGYELTNDPLEKNKFHGNKLDMSVFSHYKFNNGYILKEDSKFSPFVSLGLGLANYSYSSADKKAMADKIPDFNPAIRVLAPDFIIPVGVGLKYQITRSLAIQYQYLYNVTLGKDADNHDTNRGDVNWFKNDYKDASGNIRSSVNDVNHKRNDFYGQHWISLSFSFGKAKDTDKDGVADKDDKCPDTPFGVKVNTAGCPIDTDKDRVADYLDKCPDTPKAVKVDVNGCPLDADKDGIADYLDKCPKVPGIEKFQGCPDSDGDGIQDSEDKCPKVAGLAKFQGCPDTDGDGVQDSEDKCPTVAGTVNGCPENPDRDKDGILDKDDKCPDVAGVAANKGCPEVKAEAKKVFAQALQGIQFESGKEIIKPVSYPILNKVVEILLENPSYLVEINGHTDALGDDAKNLMLSQKRADAVKTYLVGRGVNSSKLFAKGYGETVPVADNATAEGRAKNRRVEFKVNF